MFCLGVQAAVVTNGQNGQDNAIDHDFFDDPFHLT
jgi:hypothetical protein